jgi:hypothetical protein
MPFDGTSERLTPVRTLDAPQNEPPIEARVIDEALKILGPNGARWIQGCEADGKNTRRDQAPFSGSQGSCKEIC